MTFNIYFQDTIIDSQHYENPIKHTIVNKYLYIDLDSYKNMELYFQGVSLTSDDGLIFSNIKNYHDIGFTQQNLDFFSIKEGDLTTSRCCFLIFSAKNIQKMSRQYLKISDLIAKLGGIIQGLILICYVFVHIEQILYIKQKVLNSLFVFKTENKPSLERNNKFNLPLSFIIPKSIGERPNNNEKNNQAFKTRNIEEGSHWKKTNWILFTFFRQTKRIFEFHDMKNKVSTPENLNFGIIKYLILKFKGCFTCLKLKYEEQLFQKSEKVYEEELDFIEILKKLQEFENLKKII